MAGISMLVDMSADDAFRLVSQVSRQQKYSVQFLSDNELSIRKGSLLADLIVGWMVAPYRDFRVSIRTGANKAAEVVIQPNKPWWGGVVGVRRAQNHAEELANAIEATVRERGVKVLKRSPAPS
jgi:hypothetical protein